MSDDATVADFQRREAKERDREAARSGTIVASARHCRRPASGCSAEVRPAVGRRREQIRPHAHGPKSVTWLDIDENSQKIQLPR